MVISLLNLYDVIESLPFSPSVRACEVNIHAAFWTEIQYSNQLLHSEYLFNFSNGALAIVIFSSSERDLTQTCSSMAMPMVHKDMVCKVKKWKYSSGLQRTLGSTPMTSILTPYSSSCAWMCRNSHQCMCTFHNKPKNETKMSISTFWPLKDRIITIRVIYKITLSSNAYAKLLLKRAFELLFWKIIK